MLLYQDCHPSTLRVLTPEVEVETGAAKGGESSGPVSGGEEAIQELHFHPFRQAYFLLFYW